jgi:hypothetical protein
MNISDITEFSLHDLSEDQLNYFNDVVLKDIKNESSSEDKAVLDNNLELWLYQLRIIRKDVEFQLSSQKAKDKIKIIELSQQDDVEELNDYKIKQAKWRMGAVRFLTAIEAKMLYVKMILSESFD